MSTLDLIMNDPAAKAYIVKSFTESAAVDMLDILENIYSAVDSDSLRKQLLRVSSRLAEESRKMPTSAILHAVELESSFPEAGGGYGDVFRGTYHGTPVAVKRPRIYDPEPLHRALCREAVLWRELKHPFVLPFLGIYILPKGATSLVSPWREKGDIRRYLTAVRPPALDIEKALLQVACGLEYIHSRNVTHGDIKGANILLDDNLNVQICDFGLGLWNETSVASSTSHSRSGTIRYMAPELLLDAMRPCPATDVFAFGCLAFEMHSGTPPFPKLRSEFGVRDELQAGRRSERPYGEEARVKEFDDRMWELVEKCWAHDARLRPSIEDVVSEMTGWGLSV
ncbi:kinase-like domain-containing protein [Mycena rebaudengoi]|nr:kinase-like domain-containing protein [Mycena rebaudengoi]